MSFLYLVIAINYNGWQVELAMAYLGDVTRFKKAQSRRHRFLERFDIGRSENG